MTETKSALRAFLKNEAGAVVCDLTMFLGESIELAMIVTGVAADCPLDAANGNAAPVGTAQPEKVSGIKMAP